VREAGELDAALIIMHGRGGEDGSMQGLLTSWRFPTRARVLASALAMNKELSKAIYQLAGLQVPRPWPFTATRPPVPRNRGQIGPAVVISRSTKAPASEFPKAPTLEALKTACRCLRPG